MDPYRTQYAHYKLRVEDTMERHGWLNIANGIEQRPASPVSPPPSLRPTPYDGSNEQKDWDRRDRSLREFLILTLPLVWKDRFAHISGGGFELWQAIVDEFEQETFKEHTDLLASFYNIQQDNDEPLNKYMDRLKGLVKQLASAGEKVSEESQVMCFLQGLNYYYQPEDVNILLDQNLTLDQALRLIQEFVTCKQSNRPIILKAIIAQSTQLRAPGNSPRNATQAGLTGNTASASAPAATAAKTKPKPTINASAANAEATMSPPGSTASNTGHKTVNFGSSPQGDNEHKTVGFAPGHPAENHRPAFKVKSLHRGLKNEIGENNCFLNVTIQALWHLGPFRAHLTSYINEHTGGSHLSSSDPDRPRAKSARIPTGSLLESLCNLFIQYEFTDMPALPATQLRTSLSILSDNFRIGTYADANEAFDTILQRIHTEQCTACPHTHKCLAHEVFGGCVMEQAICTVCGATSEPSMRHDFIMCFQASEMLLEAKAIFANSQPRTEEQAFLAPAPLRTPSGFSRFLHMGRNAFPSFHHHEKKSKSATGQVTLSRSNSGMDDSQSKYSAAHFGQILAKCMALTQRSCPSRDDSGGDTDTSGYVEDNGALGASGGIAAGGVNRPRYQCSGRAAVHQYSLEPPLAIALSIGKPVKLCCCKFCNTQCRATSVVIVWRLCSGCGHVSLCVHVYSVIADISPACRMDAS
jgi:hypothetical protein